MSEQQITPELRAWIIEQAVAGHQPEVVLKAMCASGWNEDVALDALEQTLKTYLAERDGAPAKAAEAPALPPAVKVPGPLLSDERVLLNAGDREVEMVLSLQDPAIVVFGGLLSHEECDELVAMARLRLIRSETVDTATGASEVNSARTSDGMFFARGENELCTRIENRMATLLRWPLENGEGLQILRYAPGAEYLPHYDYFDPDQPGTPAILKRGGQRVGTLVVYLNTPERGGATIFPDVKMAVAPVKGNAVFFTYDRAHPSTRSLHGGAPVLAGEKWVATKWMREGRFD
ncbi:2OG-Fe(II) oxygenase [soil metagenome]